MNVEQNNRREDRFEFSEVVDQRAMVNSREKLFESLVNDEIAIKRKMRQIEDKFEEQRSPKSQRSQEFTFEETGGEKQEREEECQSTSRAEGMNETDESIAKDIQWIKMLGK